MASVGATAPIDSPIVACQEIETGLTKKCLAPE
jgi:hypothetical protein